jgi:hypothetical protein
VNEPVQRSTAENQQASYHMRRLGVFISAWAVLPSLSLIPVAIGMKAIMIFDSWPAVPAFLWCMLVVSEVSFGVFFILHWRYDHGRHN